MRGWVICSEGQREVWKEGGKGWRGRRKWTDERSDGAEEENKRKDGKSNIKTKRGQNRCKGVKEMGEREKETAVRNERCTESRRRRIRRRKTEKREGRKKVKNK